MKQCIWVLMSHDIPYRAYTSEGRAKEDVALMESLDVDRIKLFPVPVYGCDTVEESTPPPQKRES